MRVVIQRVSNADVKVDSEIVGEIGKGMLILLSVSKTDARENADYLVKKLSELRIFEDENGKMNLSALDVKADFLVVSQFTLHGSCEKGRRPSFDKAADPHIAKEMYEYFVQELRKLNVKVETGQFAAMMDVSLTNNGPVTFILDTEC